MAWRKAVLAGYVDEDVGYGDITTEAMGLSGDAEAEITANEPCVLAGVAEAVAVFSQFGVNARPEAEDGAECEAGRIVMRLQGPVAGLLTAERLALNLLMHMSGIATMTRRMLDRARAVNPRAVVAATRKTTPGFRMCQKRAVAIGGGDTHRLRLDDLILIKNNHVDAIGSAAEAVRRARSRHLFKKVECEARTPAEAEDAARAGADIVLLDNMAPEASRAAAARVRAINPSIIVEVSGGIDEGNVAEYADHADVLSSGALTHSYRCVDFHMRLRVQSAKNV